MDNFNNKKDIKKILLDFDGVLTDGKIFYTHDGEQFKGINTKDIRAIRELISYGYEVIILTASNWPGSKFFAKKTGAEIIVLKDKGKYIQNLKEKYIAVGDDVWDLSLIEKSYRFFAPKNADKILKKYKKVEFLKTNGGDGIIAELVWLLK
jgi:3-deoxy-D-manno-octulosonate 8-phosphate phosphatase (KDO 8-P phosphatase)